MLTHFSRAFARSAKLVYMGVVNTHVTENLKKDNLNVKN